MNTEQVGPPHPSVDFSRRWWVWERGEPVGEVSAVSRDQALHKKTLELMAARGLECNKYINGPYTQVRVNLTAELKEQI